MRGLVLAVLLFACGSSPVHARRVASIGPLALPAPTGPSKVGRTRLEWTDASRGRTIVAYVWYPTDDAHAPRAAYFPEFARIEAAIGEKQMKDELGASYDRIKAQPVQSYALADAAPKGRAAAIIFSHGFGETSLTYAALLEDLASHGYVVFGIEHPGDAYAVA